MSAQLGSKFKPGQVFLPAPTPSGFIDKTLPGPHGVELAVRIWPAKNTSGPAPWILWQHGGGYTAGSHYTPTSWAAEGFISRGVNFITSSFRLVPHASFPEQIDDILLVHKWCQENLVSVLGADKVAIEKYGIGGDSSGAVASVLVALKLQSANPQPRVLVSAYANIDFVADRHWHRNDPKAVASKWNNTEFGWEELQKEIETRDPKNAVISAPYSWEISEPDAENKIRKVWQAPEYTLSHRIRLQTAIKDYIGHLNSMLFYNLHLDKFSTEGERKAEAAKWSPLHLVQKSTSYPPLAVYHGEADAAVPITITKDFAAHVKSLGVDVLESYEPGAPHGGDLLYVNPQVEGYAEYIAPVLDFAVKKMTA